MHFPATCRPKSQNFSKLSKHERNWIFGENGSRQKYLHKRLDTASLMHGIKIEFFYFSNYSATSTFYDKSNALVVGKMKDQTADLPIKISVGLKPKDYSSRWF